MNILIFSVGLVIFVTYMFFLVRMINTQHKKQEQENGPVPKVRIKKSKNIHIGSGGIVDTKNKSINQSDK